MPSLPEAQYALVQSARAVLLDYCALLAPADFTAPVAVFNQTSLRDLLVHVANCYRYWLGTVAQGQLYPDYTAADAADLVTVRRLFQEIDALVYAYCDRVSNDWLISEALPIAGRAASLTPLTLFTHVITHEFHHKGQLLNMSRQLGYVPVDTDIISF